MFKTLDGVEGALYQGVGVGVKHPCMAFCQHLYETTDGAKWRFQIVRCHKGELFQIVVAALQSVAGTYLVRYIPNNEGKQLQVRFLRHRYGEFSRKRLATQTQARGYSYRVQHVVRPVDEQILHGQAHGLFGFVPEHVRCSPVEKHDPVRCIDRDDGIHRRLQNAAHARFADHQRSVRVDQCL